MHFYFTNSSKNCEREKKGWCWLFVASENHIFPSTTIIDMSSWVHHILIFFLFQILSHLTTWIFIPFLAHHHFSVLFSILYVGEKKVSTHMEEHGNKNVWWTVNIKEREWMKKNTRRKTGGGGVKMRIEN